jgi:membrane protease YdiL (CAAX protease family)
VTVGLFAIPLTLYAARIAVQGSDGAPRTTFAFLTMAEQELLLIGLVVHVTRLHGEGLADFTQPPRWSDVLWTLALFVAIGFARSVVWLAVWFATPNTAAAVAALTPTNVGPYLVPASWSYAAFVTINPFCEEILMRGFLQTRLRQLGWPAAASACTSAVLQGAYHLYQGPVSALSVAAAMLVFACFYERTRRLSPVIGAHLVADVGFMAIASQYATS